VPEAPEPKWREDYFIAVPLPKVVANIPKSKAPRLDVARRQILDAPDEWHVALFNAFLGHLLSARAVAQLLALQPSERLCQIARLVAYNHIDVRHAWQLFPQDRWPVAFFEAGGRLKVVEWQEVSESRISLIPKLLSSVCARMSFCRLFERAEYQGLLAKWVGEPCLLAGSAVGGEMGAAHRWVHEVSAFPVEEHYCVASVRFLHPPWKGYPPLLQTTCLPLTPSNGPDDVEALVEKALKGWAALSPSELARVNNLLQEKFRHCHHHWFLSFPGSFSDSFGYGVEILNLNHPVAQALFHVELALVLSERRKAWPADKAGRLRDAIEGLTRHARFDRRTLVSERHRIRYWADAVAWKEFSESLGRVFAGALYAGISDIPGSDRPATAPQEFVRGTFRETREGGEILMLSHGLAEKDADRLAKTPGNPDFGKAIS
jgi:hypothetical protein